MKSQNVLLSVLALIATFGLLGAVYMFYCVDVAPEFIIIMFVLSLTTLAVSLAKIESNLKNN